MTGRQYDDVFVGRAAELARLGEHLDAVRGGRARTVVVEGPAGVGKTALLQRFLATAVGGAQVLWVSGDEDEEGRPYAVVDQLTREVGRPAERLRDLVEQVPPPHPADVGAAMLELLGSLQDDGPVVVVVDDAQWADQLSLRSMSFTWRRLYADAVLAVAVVRTDQALRLPEGLRRAAAERLALIELEGLSAEELCEMGPVLGVGRLSRATAERLRAHTRGLPIWARALLEELSPQALADQLSELPAPRSFSTLVVAQMIGLSSTAERLVTAVAVLGSSCALDVAATVAGLSDPLEALDEAVCCGLLVERDTPAGRLLHFSHPLVQAAVYDDLRPARRAAMHVAAAAATTGLQALRHRVAAAPAPDPALAGELEAAASDELRQGAFEAAAAHLLAAARVSAPGLARDRRLTRAVNVFLDQLDIVRAASFAEEVASQPSGAPRSHVLGRLAFYAGRHRQAAELLEEAWELRGADEALGAQAAAHLAQILILDGEGAQAVTWAARAMDPAATDSRGAQFAVGLYSAGLGISGRAREAIDLLTERADASHAISPAGIIARGILRLWCDDPAGAQVDLSGALGSAEVDFLGQGATYFSEAAYRIGDWDEAVARAEQIVSLIDDLGLGWLAAFAHGVASYPLSGRGDFEASRAHVDMAQAAVEVLADEASLAYAQTAAIELAYARDEPDLVIEAAAPLVRLGLRDGLCEPGVVIWWARYAAALAHSGRAEEAASFLAPFEARAADRTHRSALAHASAARAEIEAARGHMEAARASYNTALRHLDGLPLPFWHATINLDYGRLLARLSETRNAVVALSSARKVFSRLGAAPFLERCDVTLASCGSPQAPGPAPPGMVLTPRELAVARLVAKGKRNREVAAELFVSVKTVEYHLGHIYDKLGVHTRAGLAALLAIGISAAG
jgi:DNA-binding CsgD family transcriptional regulator